MKRTRRRNRSKFVRVERKALTDLLCVLENCGRPSLDSKDGTSAALAEAFTWIGSRQQILNFAARGIAQIVYGQPTLHAVDEPGTARRRNGKRR